jgi:hypothetical protein
VDNIDSGCCIRCSDQWPHQRRKSFQAASRRIRYVSFPLHFSFGITDMPSSKESFPAGASSSNKISLSQSIPACAGQSYTLTAYAGAVSGGGTGSGLCYAYLCADGNCAAATTLSTSAYSQLTFGPFTASTSPINVSVVTYCVASTRAYSVYVDSVSIQ